MNLLSVRKFLLNRSLNDLEKLQFENQISILEDFLVPLLYEPRNFDYLKDKLTYSEKLYMSFKQRDNLLAKISLPLYVANRFFYASSGPRHGRLLEDLIQMVVEKSGYKVSTRVEIHKRFGIKSLRKKYIDFVFERGDRIYLVEQRTSEHTGGRTGQESLLDKFREIMDELASNPQSFSGFREINMRISILFNENHQVINRQNMTKGRMTSLISYVTEPDNLKRFSNLAKIYRSNCDDVERCLAQGNIVKFEGSSRTITFGIWIGEEMFSELINTGGASVLREDLSEKLGDDLWIMYTLLPYEMRNYYSLGFTWVRKVYDDVVSHYSIPRGIDDENSIIRELREMVVKRYDCLPLLETNDLKAQIEYLENIIAASLIVKAIGPRTTLRI